MNLIRFSIRLIDNLNDWVGKIFSPLVVGMMAVLIWEIVARYVFGKPTNWAHETSQLLFGPFFLIDGAYILRWRGHVNIEILYQRFPLRVRAIIDLFVWMLFFFFIGIMVWKTTESAWLSIQLQETSISTWRPPIWPLKLVMPIAAFLMLIQGITIYMGAIYAAVTGRELTQTATKQVRTG